MALLGESLSNWGGSIGRYHSQMTGKAGERAMKEAGWARLAALDEAEGIYQDRYPELIESYQPFVEGGADAYAAYRQTATPEGYGQRLDEIRQSPAFEALVNQRRQEAQRQLSSSGLSRSTYGARRAADVSQSSLMGLENMLSNRQRNVASTGYGAMQAQTGLQGNLMEQLAQIARQRGGIESETILGEQQQLAQGAANQYRAMHNVGSSLMGMFGMGMGGGGGDIDVATEGYGNQGGQVNQGTQQYYQQQGGNIQNPYGGQMYGGYA